MDDSTLFPELRDVVRVICRCRLRWARFAFSSGPLFLVLVVSTTATAQPAPVLACTQGEAPSRFDERMVGLSESASYAGPHRTPYDALLARSRAVVRIKDIRDNASGSSLRFAQLTGVFFGSRCHVITNRHGVSVMAKDRGAGYRLQDAPVVQNQRKPVLNLTASPVGKVTATVEFGHAHGKPASIAARVIHAEPMQAENEVDGDLAILRLDSAPAQAQLPEFIAMDALRRTTACIFPSATAGYPIIPARGQAPTFSDRTAREVRGLSGELLVADLRCGVRSCVEGSQACDDAILRKPGFKSALVSTCIAAEGGSGSPLYVFDDSGRPIVVGLVTKTVSRSNGEDAESAWGIALARGFTQSEIERLQAVVKSDIREAGLAGCD